MYCHRYYNCFYYCYSIAQNCHSYSYDDCYVYSQVVRTITTITVVSILILTILLIVIIVNVIPFLTIATISVITAMTSAMAVTTTTISAMEEWIPIEASLKKSLSLQRFPVSFPFLHSTITSTVASIFLSVIITATCTYHKARRPISGILLLIIIFVLKP